MKSEDFKDFAANYDKNQNMIFRILINTQKAILEKDKQIKELQNEIEKLGHRKRFLDVRNSSRRVRAIAFDPRLRLALRAIIIPNT